MAGEWTKPHLQRLIIRGLDDEVPLRSHRTAPNSIRVTVESEALLARLHIPHSQRGVARGRDNKVPLRTYRTTSDFSRVTVEGETLLARLHIPHLQGTVSGG